MGLAPDLFWALTPRMFAGMAERHRIAERARDRRAGEVVAMIYNAERDAKKDPRGWTWLDVFPEHRPAPVVQTDEQMFAAMMLWAKATEKT